MRRAISVSARGGRILPWRWMATLALTLGLLAGLLPVGWQPEAQAIAAGPLTAGANE